METSLAGYLDRHYLPGKINPCYYGFGDNEGIAFNDPCRRDCASRRTGRSMVDLEPGSLDQGRGPGLGGLACLGLGILWARIFR